MVNSYDVMSRGRMRTRYELAIASNENTQYLFEEASAQIRVFIQDAIALYKTSLQDDMKYIEDIKVSLQNMEEDVRFFGRPGPIVWRIPSIISRMRSISSSVDEDDLPENFLESTRMLYLVYVLGFVDMCCTMDGGSSIIYQDVHVEPQLRVIDEHINHYPKLLDWVQESIEDWEWGEETSYQLRRDTVDGGFEAQVWYLTSPLIYNRLHSLKTYHKEGHAKP